LYYLRNLPKKDGKIKMNFRVPQQRSQLFRNIVRFYLNRRSDKCFEAFKPLRKFSAFVNIHQQPLVQPLKTCAKAKQ